MVEFLIKISLNALVGMVNGRISEKYCKAFVVASSGHTIPETKFLKIVLIIAKLSPLINSDGYSRSCAKIKDSTVVVEIADTARPNESPDNPTNKSSKIIRIVELQVKAFDKNISA